MLYIRYYWRICISLIFALIGSIYRIYLYLHITIHCSWLLYIIRRATTVPWMAYLFQWSIHTGGLFGIDAGLSDGVLANKIRYLLWSQKFKLLCHYLIVYIVIVLLVLQSREAVLCDGNILIPLIADPSEGYVIILPMHCG